MTALPFDPIARARDRWAAEGWADAADGMAAVTSLMRAHQIALSRVDAALRPFDLTFARYEVLMQLRFSGAGALSLSRIGSRLQVHPTSVTSAVDRLQAQGLVQRTPHPTDRRTTLATLTDAGRARADEATAALNEQVFSQPGLPGPDVKGLIDLLAGLRQAAGDF